MKIAKETIIKILRKLSIENNSKSFGQFKQGDVVFEKSHNEVGIVLSYKPGTIIDQKDIDKLENNDIVPSLKTQYNYIVLLVISPNELAGFDFRVRYAKLCNLVSIGDGFEFPKLSDNEDLRNHCTSECLLECSEECSLWKYRPKI